MRPAWAAAATIALVARVQHVPPRHHDGWVFFVLPLVAILTSLATLAVFVELFGPPGTR